MQDNEQKKKQKQKLCCFRKEATVSQQNSSTVDLHVVSTLHSKEDRLRDVIRCDVWDGTIHRVILQTSTDDLLIVA